MSEPEITPGAFYEVAYPFVLDEFLTYDGGGEFTVKSWRPGVRFEAAWTGTPGADPRTDTVVDAMGTQILTVISIHKPGRFPTRVFYTQAWRAPTGKAFGKARLRIATLGAFRAMLRGYRHEFDLVAEVIT